MRQTSIDSYKSILDTLGNRQKAVYEALSIAPMSNAELADFLHWPINTVTPRTNELTEKGFIKYGGIKIHPGTHRRQIVWKVVDQCETRQLRFV